MAFGVDTAQGFVITVVNADGSDPRVLPGNGVEAAWSPDGTEIAYLGFAAGEGRPLYASRPDGSGFRQIARVAGAGGLQVQNHLDWSADATTLLFHDSRDLFVVAASAGLPRQVTEAGEDVSDAVFSPGVTLRLAGASRVEIRAQASRRGFDSAPVVVVARADRYPDALAAAPLAGSVQAPVLLTPSGALHPAAAAEIQRLQPTTAVAGPTRLRSRHWRRSRPGLSCWSTATVCRRRHCGRCET